MSSYSKIVLNIPHSSTYMPSTKWNGNIEEEIKKWTDTYTDELFAPRKDYLTNNLVVPVVFNVSRFYCDTERLLNDPLEKEGQGIYYTDFNGCHREKNYTDYTSAMWLWYSHQNNLSVAMKEHCLIIDCHSFPNEVAPDVDICIGFNEDWSKPSLQFIESMAKLFEFYGYKVRLNKPYGNSITPHKDYYYNSIMIEVNKKLYLTEYGDKNASFLEINDIMNYLYENILDKWNY